MTIDKLKALVLKTATECEVPPPSVELTLLNSLASGGTSEEWHLECTVHLGPIHRANQPPVSAKGYGWNASEACEAAVHETRSHRSFARVLKAEAKRRRAQKKEKKS